MRNIDEVADGIYRLETPIITAQYPAVAYIIKSPLPVVIDPGTTSTIPMLRDALSRLGIDKPAGQVGYQHSVPNYP